MTDTPMDRTDLAEHTLQQRQGGHPDVERRDSNRLANLSRRHLPTRRRQDLVRERLLSCERKQIARQIHDDLGAVLTALKCCICCALDRDEKAGAPPNTLLADAAVMADAAFAAVRKIGVDLRPTILEQMGLWGALEWQLRSLANRCAIRTAFHVDARLEQSRFSEECERVVFRVMAEAITNVEKHAHATLLRVRVYELDAFLIASVEDDGVGASHADLTGCGSLGMVSMREQATELGGLLETYAAPGGGLGLILAVPLGYCYEH